MSGATGDWGDDGGVIIDDGATIAVGEPDPSLFSVDYYRQKVIEFQSVLNELDATGVQLQDAGNYAYASGDQQMIVEYEALRQMFESRRGEFRAVAEGIQLASQGINAAGVSFPTVQLPMGLGIAPVVGLAAAAAVIASAVALTYWAKQFWQTVRDFAQRWQYMQAIQQLPPDQQALALESLRKLELQTRQAELAADSSPLAGIASIGRWILIGGVAFLCYKIYKEGSR